MPSYRLTFDQTGQPCLEEDFYDMPPLHSSLTDVPARTRKSGASNWTITRGAADQNAVGAATRRTVAPFQFAGDAPS